MSQGPSGRMVVEMEPDLKRQLYAQLASDGLTFKQWLISEAERYLSEQAQPLLFVSEPRPRYGAKDAQQKLPRKVL